MSGSFGITTIEDYAALIVKLVIVAIVAIFCHWVSDFFTTKSVVTGVATAITSEVQTAATSIKDHITTTSQNPSPRSNGNSGNGRQGSIEGEMASTVLAAVENVASRHQQQKTPASTSPTAAQG